MASSMERKPLLSEDSETGQETDTDISPVAQDGVAPSSVQVEAITGTTQQARRIAGTTNIESIMHLLKGNIGTGILAMPDALKNAGLWTGFIGILVIGFIATHCMHVLVQCCHILCKRTNKNSLDYGEVMEASFQTGPPRLRFMAIHARRTINAFLCITQFGFCIVYILFVADNIRQVVAVTTGWCPSVRVYEALVLVALIPYSYIRNLKLLAPFSTIANFFTVLGLVVIFQYLVQDLKPVDSLPAFSSWAKLPLYFGTAIYAFEGIGVVLPIENKMKSPEDFPGLTGVLNTAMVIVTVLYSAVGFYGYLRFGDAALGSITLNMPLDHWIYLYLVRLVFAVTIFVSYGLQFYVPVIITWPTIKKRCGATFLQNYGEYFYRTALVIFTFLVAITIPHLNLMISLIGALSSSSLALIFPPLLELVVRWPDGFGRCHWRFWKDIAIMLFGIAGFLAGTVVCMIEIVNAFGKQEASAAVIQQYCPPHRANFTEISFSSTSSDGIEFL